MRQLASAWPNKSCQKELYGLEGAANEVNNGVEKVEDRSCDFPPTELTPVHESRAHGILKNTALKFSKK